MGRSLIVKKGANFTIEPIIREYLKFQALQNQGDND